MSAISMQNVIEEDARMLLDILSPINNFTNDQQTLKLVDMCFDMPQTLCNSLLCFVKIWKIDYSKIADIWLV